MSTTAVECCLKAYYAACEHEDPQNTGLSDQAWKIVSVAYRHAMPFLTPDPDAIDAFIACVTHGLVIQVFQPAEASKLLYAAQVVIGSRRARLEAAKQHAKQQTPTTPPPPPSVAPETTLAAPQVPEGEMVATQVPPQVPTDLPCPILPPGLISDRVGKQDTPTPLPPTPTPEVPRAAKEKLAAPQVPPHQLANLPRRASDANSPSLFTI